jgi:uncharacterized membrane protein
MRLRRLAILVAVAVALAFVARRVDPRVAHAIPVAINLALAALFAWTLRSRRRADDRAVRAARARDARARAFELHARPDSRVGGVLRRDGGHRGVAFARRLDGAWLAFALVGNYALIAALLVGEYLYRRRRFAHLTHASPLEMWRHASAELRERRP